MKVIFINQREVILMKKRFTSLIVVLTLVFNLCANFVLPQSITVQAAISNSSDTRSRLGVNLEGLSDWNRSKMFIDTIKTSRIWGKADKPWDALDPTQLDEYGWPTTNDCGLVVVADTLEAGTYKLSFECESDSVQVQPVVYWFEVKNLVYGDNNKVTADIIVPEGQTNLMMKFVNTVSGVRNVKLLRPGYTDDSQLFTQEFLDFLEPFSTIRFMDYLSANGQNSRNDPTPIEWENRKTPQHASQAATIDKAIGGCWEYLVELLNKTQKDGWINIPYNASDDYVTKLANFLKENVDDGINIYVELSNEVWNDSFSQANVNKLLASNDPVAHTYDLQYAKQSAEIAKIFRNVYGQDAMNNNIRVVLAWQIGWYPSDQMPRNMLEYIYNYHDVPSTLFYALAGAPYFSEPLPENCTSIDAIHEYMRNSSDSSVEGKKKFIKAALDWNLKGGALCYEGGPHHQGQVDTNLDTRMAAHRDAEMKNLLIRDLQTNWFDIGGGLFCYYSATGGYSQYGCWALSEDVTNLDTPKYQAIKQLYNENKQYTEANPSYTPATPRPTVQAGITPRPDLGNFENAVIHTSKSFDTSWSSVNVGSIVSDPYGGAGKAWMVTEGGDVMTDTIATLDSNKTYTMIFRVGGGLAELGIQDIWANNVYWGQYAYDGTHTWICGIPYYYDGEHQGLVEFLRNIKYGWDYYAIKFTGIPSFKFCIKNQDVDGTTDGHIFLDDILILQGDYLEDCRAWIADDTKPNPYNLITIEQPIPIPTPTEPPASSFDEYGFNADAPNEASKYLAATDTDNDGVYEISKPGQLYWFASKVNNSEDKKMNAKLTADIDMSVGIPQDFTWKPIASTGISNENATIKMGGYKGTFDGGNHTISNLTLTGLDFGFRNSAGLFGTIANGGIVKNLNIDNFKYLEIAQDSRCGAICGQIVTGGTVRDCYVSNSELSSPNGVAGVAIGANYGGLVENTLVLDSNVSGARSGYIVSDNNNDNSSLTGTIKNCYSDNGIASSSHSGTQVNCTANITDTVLASGEIAYKLNAEREEDVWGQELTVDAYPVLGGMMIYKNSNSQYTNTAPTPKPIPTSTPTATPSASSTSDGNETTNPTDTPSETPIADELTKAKAAAIKELESYKNPDDYRDAEKATLTQAIEKAKAAIESATDIASVEAALTSAKTSIDVIKTDVQLTEEELANAQVKKIKFTKKKITIRVGKKKTLKVKLTPAAYTLPKDAKKVKWSINKKSKKIIKFVKKTKKLNGKLKAQVKAVKKGKAVVTAKVGNKRAKCKITVK